MRYRWLITGQVQGVGFRPFVFRLANELGLSGFVRNSADGVLIEAQSDSNTLAIFTTRLHRDAPPLARIARLLQERINPCDEPAGFRIDTSTSARAATAAITPDLATCDACLADIRDAAAPRRHAYALTNCTACGPRYSIVHGIPYDRAMTTMAGFAMCSQCRREYGDPTDRRFHAQPTACQDCGPRLELIDPSGQRLNGDPITEAAQRLRAGQILAIKGIGGYHIAVRADDEAAIQRLRALKHRPAKPLAVMVATLQAADRLVHLSMTVRKLLRSPQAPVVLAERRSDAPVAASVAPASHRLGIMIAYTPLHHLLFDALGDAVAALVMTSANEGDEPIVYLDADAVADLGGLCDAMLRHDRPIERPVDDSVVIDASPDPIFVRRARGHVPGGICIPCRADEQGLALGAELKNTVGVLRGGEAILSQHLGDLTRTATYRQFTRTIDDLLALFEVKPAWVAHDLHPMYLGTSHARALAQRWDVPLVAVQHHHAHAAAVLIEHGQSAPALAIVCDGTGYGSDGTIWGGELLLADLQSFRRLNHLHPLRLPGGDAAARQPWRSALALLFSILGEGFADHPAALALAGATERHFIAAMIRSNAGCVASSSSGRVFDAVAALLGLCRENRFDAEAPMLMESAAAGIDECLDVHEEVAAGASRDSGLDVGPLVRRLLAERDRGTPVPVLAATFHEGFASLWANAAAAAAQATGVNCVGLSGGVMCNARLVKSLAERLQRNGLRVLRHRAVPPNDGGIALGQLAVAQARAAAGCDAKGSE